jgi:hypothetical protein
VGENLHSIDLRGFDWDLCGLLVDVGKAEAGEGGLSLRRIFLKLSLLELLSRLDDLS